MNYIKTFHLMTQTKNDTDLFTGFAYLSCSSLTPMSFLVTPVQAGTMDGNRTSPSDFMLFAHGKASGLLFRVTDGHGCQWAPDLPEPQRRAPAHAHVLPAQPPLAHRHAVHPHHRAKGLG